MALTFGFYNSLNGDRKYDAEQMSSLFDGIINDGVYMAIGDHFNVTAGSDLTVLVGTGRAWFNHTWTLNDSKLTLVIPTPEAVESRIDAVVLEVDHTDGVRANAIKIIEGNPSADNPQRPQLVHTDYRNQYALAYVSVAPNVTSITQANITNNIGMSDCPFVTGAVQNMVIDDLIAQWQTQWNEDIQQRIHDTDEWTSNQKTEFTNWKEEQVRDYDTWIEAQETNWSEWSESNKTTFLQWFNELKSVLDDDAAGNLNNRIDQLAKREFDHFYNITHKSTSITTDDNITTIVEDSDESTCSTTIESEGNNTVVNSVLAIDLSNFDYEKHVTILVRDGSTNISETYTEVPGNMLANPSFEDDSDHWSGSGALSFSNDAHTGLKSLSSTEAINDTEIALDDNDSYIVSLWIKNQNATGSLTVDKTVSANHDGSWSNETVITNETSVMTVPTDREWHRLSYTFTKSDISNNSNISAIKVRLHMSNGLIVDDVAIRRKR